MHKNPLAVLAALTAMAVVPASGAAAEALKYNLIAIVTDDQATWSIGCYGNREVRTPSMDRLANEGARFTNAFVPTPVCSPSRASYMTGLYGTQVGITDWIRPQQAREGLGLSTKFTTWPSVLKKHGYKTGMVGKWHLGSSPEHHPNAHGIDYFYGHLDGGWKPRDPVLEVNGRQVPVKGDSVELVSDAAVRFLAQQSQEPFALLVHYREPHTPYTPMPEQDAAVYRDLDPTIPDYPGLNSEQVKQWTRQYYACVHAIDRGVGGILAKLEEKKLADRTVVIFTSDHGYNIGRHGIHTKGNGRWIVEGKQGTRPNMFDTSMRVPMMIRWPGVVKPGIEIDEVVSHIDMFPSILGMLDVPMPEGVRQEGADFSPLLRGDDIPWRDTLYGQYHMRNDATHSMRMIRTPEWKLVRHYRVEGFDELYDLKNDAGERTNLYSRGSLSGVRKELQAKLAAWMRSIDDPLLNEELPP